MTEACIQYAFTSRACTMDKFTQACFMEISADGGADHPCLNNTFTHFLTFWCGP